ncbi:MAG: UvrD-helicase domain-containing protein, partial [Myxococcales bacterium]|nr:UvrD-helicase domain-containing protein [Myxococcales bacterium]
MTARWTVVRAAAGCGKTTDLALRWLEQLSAGVRPEQLVTITFTRRAAAELGSRVALALRACIDDEGGEAARRALGPVAPRYAVVAPQDPAVARDALERLPDAPIGTTDAFVQRLLTEFALDAALRLPDGTRVSLDLPIAPGAGVGTALQRAARRVLDPPDGSVDPDVALLATAWSFDELVDAVSQPGRWSDLRMASTRDVLSLWSGDLARAVLKHDLAGLAGLDPSLTRDVDAWTAALAPATNESGQWAVGPVVDWLASGADPDGAPWTLFGWLVSLNLRLRLGRTLKSALSGEIRNAGPGVLDLWQIVSALRYPYDEPTMVDRADALRRARDRVRR